MQLQEIFLAAMEIEDRQQRAAYLVKACGKNKKLYQQVKALLEAHERSGEFLDVPALQQMAAAKRPKQPAASRSWKDEIDLSFLKPSSRKGSLGRLLHYEVEDILGHGGCGIVFKAFDARLHRRVAIKTMMPELAVTSPARKRFLREARATAAIAHENVVSIYAVEEKPLPFLVMEFIDGETLQDRINRTGPLDLGEIISCGRQIAQGLEVAHAKGLVHRDIKPANILLERDTGRPKLTDFGLARSVDDASLTRSGVISGTPLYMSPEQAQGLKVDHRSDLFSLGSVLYVMCTGRPPFRASTAVAVLKRVVEDRPRPIREIIPEIPAWLISAIERLHAKQPERRFASAADVVRLFEGGFAPPASQPPSESQADPRPDFSPESNSAPPSGASPEPGPGAVSAGDASQRLSASHVIRRAAAAPRRWKIAAAVLGLMVAVGLLGVLLPSRFFSSQSGAQSLTDPSRPAPARPVVAGAKRSATAIDGGPFTPMFNGLDFSDWRMSNSRTIKWTINDEVVRGANSGYHPGRGGELHTARLDYRDFHFRCEMLAGQRGETGVLFRQSRTLEHGARRGYRIPNPSAAKLEADDPWGIGSVHEEVFQVGNTPLSPAAVPGPPIRPGQWYTLEIIAQGESIRVLVDGVLTTQFQATDPPAESGCIGFSCPMLSSLAVRNVEIREL